MDTLAQIGFKADTSDLVKADKALSNLETTAASTEKQLKVAESGMKSMGAASAAQASQVQKFVQVLQDEAATIGMSSKELALYKANQLGATQADKQAIVAAIDKIEAYERSAAAAKANAVATAQMGGAYGGARGAMQSFGYQLQDTIVQAQMGANAFMILSQQGSQMASAFGPTGAIVGALIAVAGVAGMVLAPSLMDSKTNAEKLTETMDKLGESAARNEHGIMGLTSKISDMAKQSKIAADAQLAIEMYRSEQAIREASSAMGDMVGTITKADYGFYKTADAMAQLGQVVKVSSGYFYSGSKSSAGLLEVVRETGEAFGKSGKEAEQFGFELLKTIDNMKKVKDPIQLSAMRDRLLEMASGAKLSNANMLIYVETINLLASKAITAADAMERLSKGVDPNQQAKDMLHSLTQQAMLAKEEFINGEAAAQKLALAFELGFDSAKQLTPELSAQVDEMEKWQQASKAADESLKKLAETQRILAQNDEWENERITKALEEMDQIAEDAAIAEMDRIDKAIEDIDRYVGVSEKAAERIEEAFADAWMNAFDGFSSIVDGMKNAFKRMLAEMAHMALTRPIMISMGMGGMLPSGASASTGGGGGLGSLSSLGGIAGGLGALGSGFTGSAALLGSGQVGTAFGLTGNLFAAGEIMTGIGAALPIIAAGAAIAAVVDKISGGGLFGTSYKTTAQDLSLSLGGGGVSGSITTQESKKRALFGGTKRRTSTEAFDTSSIDSAFDDISEALAIAAKSIGITGAEEVLKNFTASFSLSVKDKSQSEIDAAIQEWISGTTSSMVEAVFGDMLGGLQADGEALIDTLTRVSSNMAAVESISKSLGINYDLTGKAAAQAATNIVELAGGLEQLSALTSQYYSAFYSDAEQQANLVAQLSESFAALNVTMPDTREGFRALVDGLDLTSEAGQKMFAELMKLVPGMDQYLSALEAQRQVSEDAAEAARKEAEAKAEALKAQGLDLQLRLYDALGQSAEALALRRQMELDATDETLRALLLQIYAAEDAAKAQLALEKAQADAAQSAAEAADAIARAAEALRSAAIDAAQNAFGKLQESAQREKDRLGTELDLKLEAINAEKDLLKQQRDSVIDGYQEQGKAVEQYINKLEGLNDILTGFLSDTGTQANPFKELAMIYNEAKAGLLPESSRLSSVLSGVSSSGSAGFSSAFEQNRAMAIARNQAAGIQGVVGGAMGGAKSQLQWIEYQATAADEYYIAQIAKLDLAADAAQKLHDEQVGKIDEQLTEAQKQLNALLGVDDRLLTIDQALIEFYAAMSAANELGLGVASKQVEAINRVEAAIVQVGQRIVEIAKPDGRVWVPPTMPEMVKEGEPVTREMLEVLKQLTAISKANADHSSKAASMLQEMTIGGLDVRVEA